MSGILTNHFLFALAIRSIVSDTHTLFLPNRGLAVVVFGQQWQAACVFFCAGGEGATSNAFRTSNMYSQDSAHDRMGYGC